MANSNLSEVGNVVELPTFRLTATDFGYDDYDVHGCEIHRAKVSHRIKIDDIFNVYGPGSTKRGATWLGSIEESVQAFLLECADKPQAEEENHGNVYEDSDQPGLWYFEYQGENSDISYASKAEAQAALEMLSQGNVQEAMPAHASPDLSKLDDYALIAELQRRGMVVQAWSSDDFEFIGNEDEEVIELNLSEKALEKVQQQAFEQVRRDLGSIVTARGNEHLGDWWAMNKKPILAQLKDKTVDDSPTFGM